MPRLSAARKRPSKNKYAVPAVEKTFGVIQLFAANNEGYTLSEVSRRLRLPISTTSSLLYTMQDCGYLRRNEKGQFYLSMKLVSDAYTMLSQLQPREVAMPELEKLTSGTGLTSCMAVLDEDRLVWIAKVEGTGHIKLAAQVGRRMYLHHTSTGKAILAHLPVEQVDAIIASAGLPASSERTITSPHSLRRELAKVRARGFAIDDQETAIGIRGVAAPVFDHDSNLAGSVGLAGSVFEMGGDLSGIAAAVKEAAGTISKRLGYLVQHRNRQEPRTATSNGSRRRR